MKFNEDKKKAIMHYLLEKIESGAENISKSVSEAFCINQNTVHSYINQLVNEHIIERVMRGKYKLLSETAEFTLHRKNGELDSELGIYNGIIRERIKDVPGNVRVIWEYAFTEMMNNVIDHSEAETAVITIEKNYLETIVCITDNGIGIFEKIKSHFGYDTLEDAICELFKGKLTTDAENHSGEGIFFSSKVMDEFYIFSGGKVFTNNKFNDSVIRNTNIEKKGTGVLMILSNFSKRQISEIFDMYAGVENGFSKTILPLKNIFETAPISRSQAKRVCNRVSEFKEVVLDFEELDWMGQGFAHQIFVVFQKEHPEVKITPINMSEDVEKMYNHVLN